MVNRNPGYSVGFLKVNHEKLVDLILLLMLNASLASCVCCLSEEVDDLGFLFIRRNLLNFLLTLIVLKLNNLKVFLIKYYQVWLECLIHFDSENRFFEFFDFELINCLFDLHDENVQFIINFFVLHCTFKYLIVRHVSSYQEKANFDILSFKNSLLSLFLFLILRYYYVTHN